MRKEWTAETVKEQQGIDIESHEFEDEEELGIQAPATPGSFDINSLLAAMMEKLQVLTEVQEASRAENQKLFEASRAENQKLLVEVQKGSRTKNQKFLAE